MRAGRDCCEVVVVLADGWGGALNLPRRATQPERRALRGIRADYGIVYLNEGIARRGVRDG